jgi:hypothetical protein
MAPMLKGIRYVRYRSRAFSRYAIERSVSNSVECEQWRRLNADNSKQ